MAMRNLTIQLDDELIREAKALAARKGTSVSAMVAQQLRQQVAMSNRYEQAKQLALASMTEAARSGRRLPPWTREELHDR